MALADAAQADIEKMQEVESIETWICEDLDEMNIVDAMDRSGKQNTKVCWERRGGNAWI